jgi:sugar/nucleoside kinase (ribokinase family)
MKYGVGTVGIKLGKRGSCIISRDGKIVQVPAFKVKAVDPTGAGDGWNAGLLAGLCKDWDLQKCATVANAIGALVVTKRGAIAALPRKEELTAFMKSNDVHLEI